jgi:hypothetical protein
MMKNARAKKAMVHQLNLSSFILITLHVALGNRLGYG